MSIGRTTISSPTSSYESIRNAARSRSRTIQVLPDPYGTSGSYCPSPPPPETPPSHWKSSTRFFWRRRNPWSVPSDSNSEVFFLNRTVRGPDSGLSNSCAPLVVPTVRSA
ncbi:hypothetical protein ACS0TY_014229 [Phlomoides rotata]